MQTNLKQAAGNVTLPAHFNEENTIMIICSPIFFREMRRYIYVTDHIWLPVYTPDPFHPSVQVMRASPVTQLRV